jgi:hypothetical protein
LAKIWKIPTVESESYLVLGSFDKSKLLQILTLLPLFNDRKISWVCPFELDGKKTGQKWALDEEEMHG